MIGHEGLLLSDLEFYWQGCYVFHRTADGVWRPAKYQYYTEPNEEGICRDTTVEEAGDDGVELVFRVYYGDVENGKHVLVSPDHLFRPDNDWRTYRVAGGWVDNAGRIGYLDVRAPRSRMKGNLPGTALVLYLIDEGQAYSMPADVGFLCALGKRMTKGYPIDKDESTRPLAREVFERGERALFSPSFAGRVVSDTLLIYGPRGEPAGSLNLDTLEVDGLNDVRRKTVGAQFLDRLIRELEEVKSDG